MREIILVKYGEMALKGLNRGTFEDVLLRNIRYRLKKLGKFSYSKAQSTIYVIPETKSDTEADELLAAAMPRLKKVFGIAALSRALTCEKAFADISAKAVPYLEEALTGAKTFKVEAAEVNPFFRVYGMDGDCIKFFDCLCPRLFGKPVFAFEHFAVGGDYVPADFRYFLLHFAHVVAGKVCPSHRDGKHAPYHVCRPFFIGQISCCA